MDDNWGAPYYLKLTAIEPSQMINTMALVPSGALGEAASTHAVAKFRIDA